MILRTHCDIIHLTSNKSFMNNGFNVLITTEDSSLLSKLEHVNNDDIFVKRSITGDETCVWQSDVLTKQQSSK